MKQRRVLILVIFLCTMYNTVFGRPEKNICSAVLAEVKKYPKLEIQDLYKLAYQAAMGNEHMMNDTAAVRMDLYEELASIDSSSQEPLMDYITSDSSIVRVNLSVWKEQNRNQESLFEAMTKTASVVQPSLDVLRKFWDDIEKLAGEGKIPFHKIDLDRYFQKMERQSFPSVHNSKIFTKTYHPSYRIISKGSLSPILEKEGK